jgi:hypothetical protein
MVKMVEVMNRQSLNRFFEQKIKGTCDEQSITMIVDGGILRSEEFYLGAEQLAFAAYQQFEKLESAGHKQAWLRILSYISWRLTALTQRNESNVAKTLKTLAYIS